MNQASSDLSYRYSVCCRKRKRPTAEEARALWLFLSQSNRVALNKSPWTYWKLSFLIYKGSITSSISFISQNCFKNKIVVYKGTFQSKNYKRNPSILIWNFSHTIRIIMTYYWWRILSKLMKRKFGSGSFEMRTAQSISPWVAHQDSVTDQLVCAATLTQCPGSVALCHIPPKALLGIF